MSVVVGVCIDEKKIQNLKFHKCLEFQEKYGLQIKFIDPEKPVKAQGPFNVFLQRCSEMYVLAQNGDAKAKEKFLEIETFIELEKNMVVIDPIPAMIKVLNRDLFLNLQTYLASENKGYYTPTVLYVCNTTEAKKKIEETSISFPLICKPIPGSGKGLSRKMAIIFNVNTLPDLDAYFEKQPFIIQEFINHGGVLHKVFSIGDEISVVQRPSIRDLHYSETPIFFNSDEISKQYSNSTLNNKKTGECRNTIVDKEIMRSITLDLCKFLNIYLLGIDIIIDSENQHYHVVDINYLPGYIGVVNFHEKLMKYIAERGKAAI